MSALLEMRFHLYINVQKQILQNLIRPYEIGQKQTERALRKCNASAPNSSKGIRPIESCKLL